MAKADPKIGTLEPPELTDIGTSARELLSVINQLGPDLARTELGSLQELLPQQAQLGLDLQRQFLPQQFGLDLSLAQQFQPQFQQLAQGLRSQDIEAQLADLAQFTPQLSAIREASEGADVTAIRNALTQQILGDIQAGETLTPAQARSVEQSQRTAEIARGLGTGTGSANREAVQKALEGRRLGAERRGAASAFLAQESADRPSPFSVIQGAPLTATAAGQSAFQSPGRRPDIAGNIISPIASASNLTGLADQLRQQDLASKQFGLQFELAQAQANPFK